MFDILFEKFDHSKHHNLQTDQEPTLMHSQSLINDTSYPFTLQQYTNAYAALHTNYLNFTCGGGTYPNATLLKSPRLLNFDVKKQYTPPPMLSPFRKGPGLFWTHFPNIFSLPFTRPPFAHSFSCSAANSSTNAANNNNQILLYQQNFDSNKTLNHFDTDNNNNNLKETEKRSLMEVDQEDEEEKNTEKVSEKKDVSVDIETTEDRNVQVELASTETSKPSLMRSRLGIPYFINQKLLILK